MSLNTTEYLDILKEQVNNGQTASMIISGGSMSPFLEHGRDVIYFEKPDKPLKKGDIIFFQRDSGQYVVHRLIKKDDKGYYFIGDNQTETEGPIAKENIFAIVTRAKRKGRNVGPKSFWWFFFAHIWINMIPLRRFLINSYKRIHGMLKI